MNRISTPTRVRQRKSEAAVMTHFIAQASASRQKIFGENESLLGMPPVIHAATGEVAGAAALPAEFFEYLFEERAHIFSGCGVLGKEQMASLRCGKERDRSL
jgi:hypothetical protein